MFLMGCVNFESADKGTFYRYAERIIPTDQISVLVKRAHWGQEGNPPPGVTGNCWLRIELISVKQQLRKLMQRREVHISIITNLSIGGYLATHLHSQTNKKLLSTQLDNPSFLCFP